MEGLEEELERERGVMNQQQQQQQSGQKQQQGQEQQHQPHQPQKCPRCDSVNTKFCYYNNYSLSQPRYFCKSCRRYWTQGGTLRNIPVGGGCRKGKRSSSSSSPSSTKKPSSSSSASSDNLHYLNPNNNNPQQEATMNMNMNMNFSLSTKIPPLMAPSSTNPNSLYYPPGLGVGVGIGTTFLPSIIPFQSYNLNPTFINATGSSSGNQHDLQNIGVSNLALLQGFSFPSYNQNQQIPNMGIREEDQKPILPMEEESNMAGSITSHHHHLQEQQWVQNYNTMNLPISSSESPANYWINNNNNSSALINPGFNPSDLQGFVDVPQNLPPSSCSSSASSSSPSSLL